MFGNNQLFSFRVINFVLGAVEQLKVKYELARVCFTWALRYTNLFNNLASKYHKIIPAFREHIELIQNVFFLYQLINFRYFFTLYVSHKLKKYFEVKIISIAEQ
jgi:hypothetical protein